MLVLASSSSKYVSDTDSDMWLLLVQGVDK